MSHWGTGLGVPARNSRNWTSPFIFSSNNQPITVKSMKVEFFKNTSSIETHSVLHFSVPLGTLKPRYNKVAPDTKIPSLYPIFT